MAGIVGGNSVFYKDCLWRFMLYSKFFRDEIGNLPVSDQDTVVGAKLCAIFSFPISLQPVPSHSADRAACRVFEYQDSTCFTFFFDLIDLLQLIERFPVFVHRWLAFGDSNIL